MLPKTTIVGRVADEPTYRTGIDQTGREWHNVSFKVLFDEYRGKNSPARTHGIFVSWFGERARRAKANITKGALVQVDAQIATSSYQADGVSRYSINFEVLDLVVLSRPQANRQQPGNPLNPPSNEGHSMMPGDPLLPPDPDFPF